MRNNLKNSIADEPTSHGFYTDVDVMPEFMEEFSGGDLTIVFKHDYYSEDTVLGHLLLGSIIDYLTDNSYRIAKLIFIGKGVTLLSDDSEFIDKLIKLSNNGASFLACIDSIKSYNITISDRIDHLVVDSCKTVIDEIMSSLRVFNVE